MKFYSSSFLLSPSNMEGSATPKHSRLTSILHDFDLGSTPSNPMTHYSSSTSIDDAKANLKTILATRVSFNDPNIVDVLTRPDEVGTHIVKALQDDMLKNEVITDFLTDVRHNAIEFEIDMYEPLVRRNCHLCFEYSRI